MVIKLRVDPYRVRNLYPSGFRTFFLLLVFLSCKSPSDQQADLSIHWENEKPTAIVIPFVPEKNISTDLLRATISKQNNGSATTILGDWKIDDDSIVFKPLIPLTRGLKYEILFRNKKIGEIMIPLPDASSAPVITGIYPSVDTVPENLLKIYVEFSKPMPEGNSMDNFKLIKNGKDTLHRVFLDLQTELWNNEQTRLTIWLDPGRIKRDLQPNISLGAPLNKGNKYQLVVGSTLSDAEGIALGKIYKKDFIVANRDSTIPNPESWIIRIPKQGTLDVLRVELNEPLDYVLLNKAIRIFDAKGNPIEGKIRTSEKESVLLFNPSSAWRAGNYFLEIEARLEDLAGNNLNHPFDRDITVKEVKALQTIFKRVFIIK